MSKPCEAPCPKCGSLDILRRFYKRSEGIITNDYGVPPLPRWTGGNGYTWWANRDLISHHCRCCQYDWVDAPLPKQGGKKQSASSSQETPADEVGECPTCRAGTGANGRRVHLSLCPATSR